MSKDNKDVGQKENGQSSFEWSHETYQNVASNLNVDLQKGLSSEEVKFYLFEYNI